VYYRAHKQCLVCVRSLGARKPTWVVSRTSSSVMIRTCIPTVLRGLAASCVLLALSACRAQPPDGVFACTVTAECPTGLRCAGGLCRRHPLEDDVNPSTTAHDAGADASPDAVSGTGGKRAAFGGNAGDASKPAADGGGEKPSTPTEPEPTLPPTKPFEPHTFVPLPAGRSIVAGGNVARSASYQLVHTLGQSPATGYPVRSSSKYRMLGGAIGVVQTEK